MRIIAGTLKNRSLHEVPKGKYLRPILARIKKSVFDIIRPRLAGSDFLDLYAGTGSVGIEAVSRGAGSATFVDADFDAVETIKKNISKFGIENNTFVFRKFVTSGLGWMKQTARVSSFDIIFAGPPYKERFVNKTISVIEEAGILKADGLLVIQHHKKEEVAEGSALKVVRTEKYGDTVVTFLKSHT